MSRLTHFTDRKGQIAAFDALWDDGSPWLLVLSGMSGNGKSMLIDWLIEKRCRPQKIAFSKMDMGLSGGLNCP
ncbi:MAG: hypothetical protein D3924_06650, partial [Candidatus Electrothrix sp. AR4]|nr:hypothetical protein [Candidatus Electrothrix sp. AR4]